MDKVFIRNFLIFAFLLISSVGTLTYYFISNDIKSDNIDNWISHTYEIIAEAEELNASINGIVAAQRGYLITNDTEFLSQYSQQKSTALKNIEGLKKLTKNSISQQNRLIKLEENLKKFYQSLEKRTKRYDFSQNTPKSSALVLDEIRDIDELKQNVIELHKNILNEEYKLLNLRISTIESKKKQYLITLIGGIIIGAILLLIFNSFLLGAQRKRSKIEENLKDAQERLTLALDGMRDGIFDWNLKNNTVFYSAQFFNMLGYENASLEGTPEDFRKLLHPDESTHVWKKVEEYLSGRLSEYNQEFRLKHKEGHWVWIQSRARALFDSNNQPYRMVGAHTDITHTKKEQERLQTARKIAEDANTAKGDFLAHMSHEIRTPLTAISGIAEILDKKTENLEEKQIKLIKTLGSSTAALKEIVNDVLDFSKIESGEIDLNEKLFSLNSLFAEIISMMSVRANEKQVNFIFDDNETATINFYGDSGRLRQILVNLIGNAVKFTPEKGNVTVHTKLNKKGEEQFLQIDVCDTGIGIKPEDFDTIFERFKQADSSISRKYGGTGLGLPISKNLAQLMGGDIHFSSKAGKGSTFSLILPMKVDYQMEQQPSKTPLSSKLVSKKVEADQKILLVEDYEGNIIVISYILDDMNVKYDVARTGLEAIKLWKENNYNLILMDVQMPEMDGLKATKTIRQQEAGKGLTETPIVGMTAHASVEDKEKCIKAGMNAYLPKPIVENDLKEQIVKFLG